LLEKIAPDLAKFDVQVVVLGTGEKKYQNLFKELNKKYPDKIGLSLSFDENLAHLIEAGSDMFLMPSRYEPCGLNQLYSLKYGTVPIVRKTGGLSDTIIEFNPEEGTGTGFVFDEYEAMTLLKAIQRAVSLYKDTKLWKKLMRNGMKQDFSWSTSAKQYLKIYEKILKK
jgi:starch synthase